MGAMKQLAIEDTERIMGMLNFDDHVRGMDLDGNDFFEDVFEQMFVESGSAAEGLMRAGWKYASCEARERFLRSLDR